jgi:hypothetical protein
MEDNPETWPPAPTNTQAESSNLRRHKPFNLPAFIAGIVAGFIYYGIVWRAAYRSCYPPDTSGLVAVVQLPFGIPAPLLPKFITGLGIGLGILLLLSILIYRQLNGFGKGLTLSFIPCLLTFLFVLQLFLAMHKLP